MQATISHRRAHAVSRPGAGLSETAAGKSGFRDIAIVINARTDIPNFMGGKLSDTKLVVERALGKILGTP